ncbi:S1C family serine protease [Angustibacter luteus]|uniref:S1C family serine protease n=1 Tax=Angustibacter luteus TaxID=658456 RepID=A0ABW1JDD8_9ACTN
MDTTQAPHSGRQDRGTAFGPAPRAAHRCRSTRRSSRTAAGIALALGLVATGGVAHAAGVGTATAPRSQTVTTADWSWGDQGYGDQGYGDQGYGDQGYGSYGDLWNGSGTTQQQDTTGGTDTTDASDAASVGLVEITSTLTNGTAAGTGIVLSSDGTIVTNHHVVAGATAIKVTVVSTGQTYTAHYVGADPVKDVAVLKLVGAQGLQTASLDSSGVQSGDDVTAVGDANGDGGSLTAAAGTVTALDQSITVSDEDGTPHQLTGLIEVNADVIPGDSGGALLGSDGKVVGMNVAASSGTSDIRGYVIPLSTVLTAVQAITSGDDTGSVELGYPAYLGIGLGTDDSSATVAGVLDGTPAAGAGLQAGDVITAIDGTSVGSSAELRSALATHQPGDQVRVTWTTSDGQQQSATVTLGEGPIA